MWQMDAVDTQLFKYFMNIKHDVWLSELYK